MGRVSTKVQAVQVQNQSTDEETAGNLYPLSSTFLTPIRLPSAFGPSASDKFPFSAQASTQASAFPEALGYQNPLPPSLWEGRGKPAGPVSSCAANILVKY